MNNLKPFFILLIPTLLLSPYCITIIGEANILVLWLLHSDASLFGGLQLFQQSSFDVLHCVSCIYNKQ